jgi:hypothetical protein
MQADVTDILSHEFDKAWLDLLVAEGRPDFGTVRMADDREYLIDGLPGDQACASRSNNARQAFALHGKAL